MLKRRLALSVAALAVLAGGTAVALGATAGRHEHSHAHRHLHARAHPGLLHAAAVYLGTSPGALRDELATGKTLAQIAAATPGKSAAGLSAALVAAGRERLAGETSKLPAKVEALVDGRPARKARARTSLRVAALTYLGIERKALAEQLRSGRTLAQIADATPGKSADGLQAALLASVKSRLGSALSAGKITKTAEAHRLAAIEKKLPALLARVHHKRQRHAAAG